MQTTENCHSYYTQLISASLYNSNNNRCTQDPAIFVVCSGVSLHISETESIRGYGCRVCRVAYFGWHKLAFFSELL